MENMNNNTPTLDTTEDTQVTSDNNVDVNQEVVKGKKAKKIKKKKTPKQKAITIIIWLFVASVVVAGLYMVDYDAIISSLFEEDYDDYMNFNYYHYPPDYETDILKDEEYLALDRTVSYSNGTTKLGDVDLNTIPGCSVIRQYLDAMINGNAEKYNSLFTDEYYQNEKHKPLDKIPQQRIYNILVTMKQPPHTYTSSELKGKYTGITRHFFTVEYCIQYNTGTVRGDIPSDASKPLYVEVFEYPDGSIKINNMYIAAYVA